MNCENLQSRLSAYLDGELSGRDMLAVRSHLHQCPECAQILEIERITKEAIAGMQNVEPPVGFEERLVAHVFRAEAKSPRIWRFGVALVATSAVACAATLGYLRMSAPSAPTIVAGDSGRFEDQRNQAMTAGADPFNGGNMVITASAAK